MSEIFISHATDDKPLAELFVALLREGIGVPGKAIFCSSVKGHGIPFGEDFNEYLKQQIQQPELVFLLMTPVYIERPFCLMELGAAWAKSLKSIPVIAPPVGFDFVAKTLGLKQGWNITDESGLIDLRQMVREKIKIEERDDHTWEKKRAEWKIGLKKLLSNLAQPTKVSTGDYEALKQASASQSAEITALQSLLEEANDKLEAVKSLKDAAEVAAAIASVTGDEPAEEQFEELIEAVQAAWPEGASTAVFKHILLEHFNLAGTIDWFADGPEFEKAIQYKLLSADDGNSPLWNRPKLKKLSDAINDVVTFLDSEEGQALAQQEEAKDRPMECDDLAFWEYHLNM